MNATNAMFGTIMKLLRIKLFLPPVACGKQYHRGLYKISKMKVLVAQCGLTLCDPMDYSSPGSSTHGIFQARILEWVAVSFSRGYSTPRNWTQAPRIAGRFFTIWATRESQPSNIWGWVWYVFHKSYSVCFKDVKGLEWITEDRWNE